MIRNNSLMTSRPSGRLYLMMAVLILGSASAVIRKLTEIGAQQAMGGHNPISFCNVLFVGNLCALMLMGVIHQRQWRMAVLKTIKLKQWVLLTIVALLSSAVIPTLIFSALSLTSVNNVILIGQIDAPLALALSVLFLGDRTNRWVTIGAGLAFVGVVLTVMISPPTTDAVMTMKFSELPANARLGDLLILLAAVCKAVSNTMSKLSLKQVPLGVFNVYRMLVGTAFFFVVTLLLFDVNHFMDITSPFVWKWMLLYGAVIVFIGQLAWFKGLSMSTPSETSLAAACNPLAGMLAAFLILKELPTTAQYVGGVVILVGIICNQIGIQKLNGIRKKRTAQQVSVASVSFRGA